MISSHCGDLADMVPGSIAVQQQHQQCKGLRILLVGSCSQGSIAVWDVLHKQQVIAIHSPELQLFGLLPLQPQLPTPATCAADAARQPKQRRKQQQQQCQPVVVALLALAAAKSSSNKTALVVDLPLRSAAVSEKRVEEQLHLRPILLQQPNCLCAGSPMLQLLPEGEHHHQQQQQQRQQPHAPNVGSSTSACDGHVTIATLSGRTAAAVLAGSGAVQVWDVITGQVITSASSAAGHPAPWVTETTAAASKSAAKVAAGERSGRIEALRVMVVPADECDEGNGGMSAATPGQHVLLMTGDTDGMMALTWL